MCFDVPGSYLAMSDKELVIEADRQLPGHASIEEIVDEIEMPAAIQKGERAAGAGRVVSQFCKRPSSLDPCDSLGKVPDFLLGIDDSHSLEVLAVWRGARQEPELP
jgi:hypothetical protein